jgi:diguanylate cyclase (GGDEF)-like protein
MNKAADLLSSALKLAEDIQSKAEIYRVHLSLAELYETNQAFAKALYHHKTYTSFKDEVFNASSDQKLQSLQVSFQVEQTEREREIYKLKNVELAQANQKLQALNKSLKDLNKQKTNLLKQLERQALEDPLTGLFNRRHFDQQTKALFAEAQTSERLLSIMMCDIDNFKSINDSFSHQMGDEVLIKVAALFKKGIRQSDVLARYGGEEFILAMPDTPPEVALTVCERLRASIEMYPWAKMHPKLKVTISVGVATELSVENFEKMISFADEKLYEAKRNGKNQVCA